jgi:hypothetical protein
MARDCWFRTNGLISRVWSYTKGVPFRPAKPPSHLQSPRSLPSLGLAKIGTCLIGKAPSGRGTAVASACVLFHDRAGSLPDILVSLADHCKKSTVGSRRPETILLGAGHLTRNCCEAFLQFIVPRDCICQ